MIDIESLGWNIFLLIAVAIILYFIWRFLNETKRIQEKMKGMKSFGDIIDATNQALDEFNQAFDEATQLIDKKQKEMSKLIARADESIKRMESLLDTPPTTPHPHTAANPEEPAPMQISAEEPASGGERVDDIKKYLRLGKTHEEVSRITGASIREVKLVERFSTGGK